MGLWRYIAYRVAIAFVELFAVSFVTFALSRLSGNPLGLYISSTTPTTDYPAIIAEYHLNDPIPLQYYYYLIQLLHGDLGISRVTGFPVLQTLVQLTPWTLELVVSAVILAFGVGVPIGILAGWRKGGKFDAITSVFSAFEVSVPYIVIGIAMIILFYYYPSIHGLPSLPSSGGVGALIAANHPLHTVTGVPLLDALLTGNFAYFDSSFAHMIMPAVTLSIFPMGYIIATVKSNTTRILSEDNVFLLRASGISWRRILFVHALKNNLVYLFTLAGLLFSSLLGTTVVVERIFGWPGLGSWAANSILSADVAGVLGFTTVVSLAFILTSLAIDLIYPLIDPRIGAQN